MGLFGIGNKKKELEEQKKREHAAFMAKKEEEFPEYEKQMNDLYNEYFEAIGKLREYNDYYDACEVCKRYVKEFSKKREDIMNEYLSGVDDYSDLTSKARNVLIKISHKINDEISRVDRDLKQKLDIVD